MICPPCNHAAAYHTDAGRTLVSLFGPFRYQRAYYYGRRCGKGQYPFDVQAGLPEHQLTPAVERLASLAGGVSPSFEKGAELLEERSGVDLAESTVERTTEDVGRRMAALQDAGVTFGPRLAWSWRLDAKGRRVAYVSRDATGTRQQGPGGRKTEGRMAAGWHIGSGVVESACKTVVGPRLKGAGLRWGEEVAHAMCHVRALYRSEKGQWQAFWDHQFSEPFVQQAA